MRTLPPGMRYLLVGLGLVLAAGSAAAAEAGPFSDVPATHPESKAITLLRDISAMSGFEDGSFHPDEPITRAGVVKVAMLARGRVPLVLAPDAKTSYPDIPATHGVAGLMERAVQLGIFTPDGETKFRPDEPATRAEALKIALTIFGIAPAAPSAIPYIDLSDTDWVTPYAVFATNHGLIRARSTTFGANTPMSRAELARVVATIVQAERDALRPVLPTGVATALVVGWLLFALPLALLAFQSRRPLAQRAGMLLASIVLGPVGAIGLALARIVQHAPRPRPATDVPRRSRRGFRRASGGMQRFIAWVGDVQLELVGLVLACGFSWIVVEAGMIVLATIRAREALKPLLHG